MKKRNIIVFLIVMMYYCLFQTCASAEEVTVGYGIYDGSVYSGGIFDMAVYVSSGAERASYQWQVDASMGNDSWYDLEESDNDYGFHGTRTDHLKLISQASDNSYEVGSGWEDIPFRCKVTLDGKTYYTSPMTMQFETHSLFLSRIKKENYGINTQLYRGVFNQRNENGTLYGEAIQGEQLTFWVSSLQPDYSSMYGRSEVRFVPEIVINDNGKIKKAEKETTYVPSTQGKDILIVDYNVRMMMGINDLGIIDTCRMIITVKEPETSGFCYAKYDMSLLKEMYNESQKLASIPKNSALEIIENSSGTWYKVLYNGYTGYVPSSSIIIRELIPYVSVHVDDPAAGNTPYFSAVINGKGYMNYHIEPVSWIDKTTGKFMKQGEKFVEGHSYSVSIWIAAQNEYEFDVYENKPSVSATINGHEAKVNVAYEQDPERVIELTYDYGKLESAHVCTPVYVAKVNPTCEMTGHEAYWHCECGKNYKDSRGQNAFELGQWGIIPALEHTAGEWKYNGTHHYRKCVNCMSVIAGTTAAHSGGTATCTQLAKCSICGSEYGQYANHTYSKEWTALSDEGHVHLCTNKDCPAHDTILKHTKGPEATETSPQVCTECGYIITPVKNHRHSLSKVEKKEATCLFAGNTEYYACSGCSQLFKDEKGTKVIADNESVVLPPLGHAASELWMKNESFHYRICEVCECVLDETKMAHEDLDEDDCCDTCTLLMVEKTVTNNSRQPEATQHPSNHVLSELWMSDETYHYRTCEDCGVIVDETKMLHEDLDLDDRCDTCYMLLTESGLSNDPMTSEPDQQIENQSGFSSFTGMGLVFGGGFASAIAVGWLILKKKKQ